MARAAGVEFLFVQGVHGLRFRAVRDQLEAGGASIARSRLALEERMGEI